MAMFVAAVFLFCLASAMSMPHPNKIVVPNEPSEINTIGKGDVGASWGGFSASAGLGGSTRGGGLHAEAVAPGYSAAAGLGGGAAGGAAGAGASAGAAGGHHGVVSGGAHAGEPQGGFFDNIFNANNQGRRVGGAPGATAPCDSARGAQRKRRLGGRRGCHGKNPYLCVEISEPASQRSTYDPKCNVWIVGRQISEHVFGQIGIRWILKEGVWTVETTICGNKDGHNSHVPRMLRTKIQLICLLFAVLAISKVNCMSMREEENEILDDDEKDDERKFKSEKEITPTPGSTDTTPDSTESSPDTADSGSDSTTTESSSESPHSTPAPKRDTFLRFIDDLFQVPLKMLKMFSNILSRSLEAFTSKPSPHSSDN
ncbi:hypothetical protein LSTR_LSTR002710 [Laodelphax striatellus]|uniref:Uncharacterized protein n=1 Tax=Laodelphax striatellus TaxID=195883 RepID=A0A482X6G0_LAOST|nr:hypothetical protein LSTR_LSTR002710 [Laodelphax striatellus]